MKQIKHRLWLAAGLLALLTGCFSQSLDELYAPPRAPDDYLKLDNKISEVLDQGGEYAAPLTGELTQKVQLQDLDGDGIKEAIAFFRVSADERPLKIYIYRQVEEDYEVAAVIEGQGGEAAINAVSYENLDDGPCKEIVVSWQVSDQRQLLSVYSIDGEQTVEELVRTEFTGMRIFDLDSDGQKELIVLHELDLPQAHMTEEGGALPMSNYMNNRVELYNVRDGKLALESTAPLSQNVTGMIESGVKTGYLRDMVPAVFVPSYYGGMNGRITDIFAWQAGQLKNITLEQDPEDPAVWRSHTVRWYNVAGSDINADGILELPDPYGLPDYNSAGSAPNFWAVRWQQFDVAGQAWPVYTTYHNERDGWYFILPDEWEGKITLSRSDLTGGGERAVVFSYWEGDKRVEPQPFLTIYQLYGDNKLTRANLSGRFRLRPVGEDESEAIYAARFNVDSWNCGLSEEEVVERFHLILTDLTGG